MTTPTDQTLYQPVTFLPNSTFYWLMRGFHRTFETGVACYQETLTPPDIWSRYIWDLHIFYMYLLRPIFFLNYSLFFRTMLFEYPLVLSLFCHHNLKKQLLKLIKNGNFFCLLQHPNWLHKTMVCFCMTLHVFMILRLANNYCRGFTTRNACITNTVV